MKIERGSWGACLATIAVVLMLATSTGAAQSAAVPSWAPTNGPYGARVSSIVTLSNDELVLSTDHGIYRGNGESDWTRVNAQRRNRLIAATPGGALLSGAPDSIMRSVDTGRTWQAVRGLGRFVVNSFRSVRGDVYGLCREALLRSTDDGASWDAVVVPGATMPTCIAGLRDGTMLLQDRLNVWRSSDTGRTWTATAILGNEYPGGIFELRSGDVIACGGSSAVVFRSSDRGRTWTTTEMNRLFTHAAESSGGTVVLTDNTWIRYRSTDGGATWALDTITAWDAGIIELTTDRRGRIWAGVASEGVIRLDEQQRRWTNHTRNIAASAVWVLQMSMRGNMIAGYTLDRLFISDDTARTFRRIPYLLDIPFDIRETATGAILLSSTNGTFRTTDRGISYEKVYGARHTSLLTLADGTCYAAAYLHGLYRSTDDGRSWRVVAILDSTYSDREFVSMAPGRNGEIYIGSWAGHFLRYRPWDTVRPIIATSIGIGRVESIVLGGGDTIFCGTWGGTRRSTDNGATWKTLDNPSVLSKTNVARARNGHLFASTYWYGVRRSVDGGDHWASFDRGLEFLDTRNVLALDDGRLFVGTHSAGVWESRWDQPAAALEILPSVITFDTTEVRTRAFVQTVVVRNSGDDTLRDVSIVATAGTTASQDLEGLAPGETRTMRIEFVPQDTVTSTTGLTIRSNAWSDPNFIRFAGVVKRSTSQAPIAQQRPPIIHPMPVDESATIELDLRTGGRVRLSIADISGAERAVIAESDQPSGPSSLWWKRGRSRELPAGVYLLRAETPDGTSSSIIVLR